MSTLAFEITGKVFKIYPVQQVSETFKKREFIIERVEDINGRTFSNFIKFQITQEKTVYLENYNVGQEVKVSFNIRGTKWNKNGEDSFFTNLEAWRITNADANNNQTNQAAKENSSVVNNSKPTNDIPTDDYKSAESEDLPF